MHFFCLKPVLLNLFLYFRYIQYTNISLCNKDPMYLGKLYRTFRFFVTLIKFYVLFIFLGRNLRYKTTGYKMSFASVFTYLTYDYLCKLFSRKECEQDETYAKTGCGKDSETARNLGKLNMFSY